MERSRDGAECAEVPNWIAELYRDPWLGLAPLRTRKIISDARGVLGPLCAREVATHATTELVDQYGRLK